MKKLPLSQGKFAIIDNSDFAELAKSKWSATNNGKWYAVRTIHRKNGGTKQYMHRIILGAKPHQLTDHKNGNGLDNRRTNLRICNRSENGLNSTKRRNNTSGIKGVSFHKAAHKWQVQVRKKGIRIKIGLFESKIKAAMEYKKEAGKLHGEFYRE